MPLHQKQIGLFFNKVQLGVSHRLDKHRMKQAESDGGRYLNSNTGILVLFCFWLT